MNTAGHFADKKRFGVQTRSENDAVRGRRRITLYHADRHTTQRMDHARLRA